MAMTRAKVITVSSVRGGSGKSTFVMNFAYMLSKRKLKTVILDLDLSGGVIAASLNMPSSNDVYALVDDMMNNRFTDIQKYVNNYNEYIDIISAPNDPRKALKIHYQYVENIIKQLQYRYDVVLIDTSHCVSSVNSVAFDNSDHILYVSKGDLMDIKSLKTMLAIYDDMNLNNYEIIINESLNKNVNIYEIEKVLNKDFEYVIPKIFYDENYDKYIYDGKILIREKPKGKVTKIFNDIIDKLFK